MASGSLTYNVTSKISDFQGYIGAGADYLLAMLGVVLCASFLAIAIVVNIALSRFGHLWLAPLLSALGVLKRPLRRTANSRHT